MYSKVEEAGYLICEDGTILSKRGKPMAGATRERGYRTVSLMIEGESKTFKIHRLVAWKFCPNPYNKDIVNHKDKNPSNNHKDNLEWCWQKENTIHAHHGSLEIEAKIVEAKLLREQGMSYPKLGKHFGVDHKTVWNWLNKEVVCERN